MVEPFVIDFCALGRPWDCHRSLEVWVLCAMQVTSFVVLFIL